MPSQSRLSGPPDIDSGLLNLIEQDWIKCLKGWWPDNLNHYLITKYQVDISARYAGQPISNPFGKASGQLTMNIGQIRESAEAGLGFVVLKTLIAQNAEGHQSMSEWSIPESKMQVEPIKGQSGRSGWTITWKGRGWSRSFEDYIQLCRDSFEISMETGLIVAPSVKFHLPANLDENWEKTELGKKYDIFNEDDELVGQQYETDTGPIDVLAISKDKKRLLVVELKRGRASDVVVGQVLRYMGFVKEQIAEDDQSVEGVIIALEDDQKLRWAISSVPAILFYRYQISFKLIKG